MKRLLLAAAATALLSCDRSVDSAPTPDASAPGLAPRVVSTTGEPLPVTDSVNARLWLFGEPYAAVTVAWDSGAVHFPGIGWNTTWRLRMAGTKARPDGLGLDTLWIADTSDQLTAEAVRVHPTQTLRARILPPSPSVERTSRPLAPVALDTLRSGDTLRLQAPAGAAGVAAILVPFASAATPSCPAGATAAELTPRPDSSEQFLELRAVSCGADGTPSSLFTHAFVVPEDPRLARPVLSGLVVRTIRPENFLVEWSTVVPGLDSLQVRLDSTDDALTEPTPSALVLPSLPGAALSLLVDSTIRPGGRYTAWLRPWRAGNAGLWTPTTANTGLLALPLVVNPRAQRLELSWDAVAGAVRYEIRSKAGATSASALAGLSPKVATRLLDTLRALSESTTYGLEVVAYDAGSAILARTFLQATTLAAPAEPTGLAFDSTTNLVTWTGTGSDSVRWAWTDGTDSLSGGTRGRSLQLPSSIASRSVTVRLFTIDTTADASSSIASKTWQALPPTPGRRIEIRQLADGTLSFVLRDSLAALVRPGSILLHAWRSQPGSAGADPLFSARLALRTDSFLTAFPPTLSRGDTLRLSVRAYVGDTAHRSLDSATAVLVWAGAPATASALALDGKGSVTLRRAASAFPRPWSRVLVECLSGTTPVVDSTGRALVWILDPARELDTLRGFPQTGSWTLRLRHTDSTGRIRSDSVLVGTKAYRLAVPRTSVPTGTWLPPFQERFLSATGDSVCGRRATLAGGNVARASFCLAAGDSLPLSYAARAIGSDAPVDTFVLVGRRDGFFSDSSAPVILRHGAEFQALGGDTSWASFITTQSMALRVVSMDDTTFTVAGRPMTQSSPGLVAKAIDPAASGPDFVLRAGPGLVWSEASNVLRFHAWAINAADTAYMRIVVGGSTAEGGTWIDTLSTGGLVRLVASPATANRGYAYSLRPDKRVAGTRLEWIAFRFQKIPDPNRSYALGSAEIAVDGIYITSD